MKIDGSNVVDDWHSYSKSFAPIPPPEHPTFDLYAAIDAALQEDAGDFGDITTLSTIPETTTATATLLAKADGVIAGLYVGHAVFHRVDPGITVTWNVCDGDRVLRGQILATATGPARSILIAERIVLNFMQRMSGISTMTADMVAAVDSAGNAHSNETGRATTTVLDTRKTVPGLRVLDKWAVKIGGGANHRIGLYDMVMIKDNHIAAAGSIAAAVAATEKFMKSKGIVRPVEVEARTLEEVQEVIYILDSEPNTTITRIMLDNMTKKDEKSPSGIDTTMLQHAMQLIGERQVETEASGNVTLATVAEIAKTGVQFVSCGALTHSVTALDISLNIETR